MKFQTFKILFDGKSYPVTLDDILCDLLAIKYEALGEPLKVSALLEDAVESYIQGHLPLDMPTLTDSIVDTVCRQAIILHIADPELLDMLSTRDWQQREGG